MKSKGVSLALLVAGGLALMPTVGNCADVVKVSQSSRLSTGVSQDVIVTPTMDYYKTILSPTHADNAAQSVVPRFEAGAQMSSINHDEAFDIRYRMDDVTEDLAALKRTALVEQTDRLLPELTRIGMKIHQQANMPRVISFPEFDSRQLVLLDRIQEAVNDNKITSRQARTLLREHNRAVLRATRLRTGNDAYYSLRSIKDSQDDLDNHITAERRLAAKLRPGYFY